MESAGSCQRFRVSATGCRDHTPMNFMATRQVLLCVTHILEPLAQGLELARELGPVGGLEVQGASVRGTVEEPDGRIVGNLSG